MVVVLTGIGNAIRAGVGKMIPSSMSGKAALGITALGGSNRISCRSRYG
jgi:hypothetical protein